MGLAKDYWCTKFEVSSFTRSKDTAQVPCSGWVRGGECKLSVDLRRFLTEPHQIWRQYSRMVMLYANVYYVLDFRYTISSYYRITALKIVCDLARKMVQI